MKYIKINTPLQVVGGFTVNEAIGFILDLRRDNIVFDLYKDLEAYNKKEERLKLKVKLPDVPANWITYGLSFRLDKVYTEYLSILLANDYDAEIVDTDAPKVDECVSIESGTTVNGEVTIKVEIDKDKLKNLVKEMVTVTSNKIEAYVVEKDLKSERDNESSYTGEDGRKYIVNFSDGKNVSKYLSGIDVSIEKIKSGLQNVNVSYGTSETINYSFEKIYQNLRDIANDLNIKFITLNKS